MKECYYSDEKVGIKQFFFPFDMHAWVVKQLCKGSFKFNEEGASILHFAASGFVQASLIESRLQNVIRQLAN